MSVSYYAKAALGFKLDPNVLFTVEEKEVRGCKCKSAFNQSQPPKFCPECGKPWTEKKKTYKLIDDVDIKGDFDEERGRFLEIDSINGYEVIETGNFDSPVYILCLNKTEIDSNDMWNDIYGRGVDIGDGDPDHFPALYRRMIETLPRDLWDTREGFRLWIGISCG